MSTSSVRTQSEETKIDRDVSGRLGSGNSGGPGNPFARRVAELRKTMLHALGEEDIAQILEAMVQKAKEGNVQAAKLVLSYTLGKPEKLPDPDCVEEETATCETPAVVQEEPIANGVSEGCSPHLRGRLAEEAAAGEAPGKKGYMERAREKMWKGALNQSSASGHQTGKTR